jgi:uncharacterized protein
MPPTGSSDVAGRPVRASFRFYAELNDFLPEERRGRDIDVAYVVSPSVKDAIEALGVPHVEVDLVLVNGRSVGFDHRITPGDRISVYPIFESLDVSPVTRLRTTPLRRPRFVADVHLRKLARILRLLGFDVLYSVSYDDASLIKISTSETRILLTRDRALLKHGDLTHGYWVRSVHAQRQAIEVVRRFDLAREVRPFSRCPVCNGLLQTIDKREALDRIPPKTAAWLDEYVECTDCGKLYWEGTHTKRIHALIERILKGADKP